MFGDNRFDNIGRPDYGVVSKPGVFGLLFEYEKSFDKKNEPIGAGTMVKLQTHSAKIQKGRSLMTAAGLKDFLLSTIRAMEQDEMHDCTMPPEIETKDKHPCKQNESWIKKNMEWVAMRWLNMESEMTQLGLVRKMCGDEITSMPEFFAEALKKYITQ